MSIRRGVARAYWAVSRWRLVTERPDPDRPSVLVGAPHTSNWDFVLMVAICWRLGMRVRYLGKAQLFRPPFGWVMRAFGGIPVDRRAPGGLVADLVARIRAGEVFHLVIAPEGTRAATPYWRSGFYRVALEAGLPVTLGYVDRATMTAGLGPTLTMTGDVVADMDAVRAFYADKTGVRPALVREPRLRAEDEQESLS